MDNIYLDLRSAFRRTHPRVSLGHDRFLEIPLRKIRIGRDHAAQVEARSRFATIISVYTFNEGINRIEGDEVERLL